MLKLLPLRALGRLSAAAGMVAAGGLALGAVATATPSEPVSLLGGGDGMGSAAGGRGSMVISRPEGRFVVEDAGSARGATRSSVNPATIRAGGVVVVPNSAGGGAVSDAVAVSSGGGQSTAIGPSGSAVGGSGAKRSMGGGATVIGAGLPEGGVNVAGAAVSNAVYVPQNSGGPARPTALMGWNPGETRQVALAGTGWVPNQEGGGQPVPVFGGEDDSGNDGGSGGPRDGDTRNPGAPGGGGGPLLTPGQGFSSATQAPTAIGNPSARGYDAKAIARWDVVPYQTFSGRFNVGVVAFHMNGIDRVEFSVEGGPWVPVYEKTLNPQTNVWEYWATLDAADFADGPVEVRAVAYPTVGEPRVLQDATGQDPGDKSLRLFANAGGTLPNTGVTLWVSPTGNDTTGLGTQARPYGSIRQAMLELSARSGGYTEGGTIYLMPGAYVYPDMGALNGAARRWVTLSGAPGTLPRDVLLRNPPANQGGVSQRMLHVRNLRLAQNVDAVILKNRSGPYGNHFWIDGCEIVGLGFVGSPVSTQPVVTVNSAVTTFYTDVRIENTTATGFGVDVVLIRNVDVKNLGSDLINSRRMSINVSLETIRYNPGVHPDIVQVPIGSIENMIVYGLRAVDCMAQGINIGDRAHPMSNVAIVNALVHKHPSDPQRSFLGGGSSTNHLLYWHVTHVNYYWAWDNTGLRNVSVRNCVIHQNHATNMNDYPNLVMENNHFVQNGAAFGSSFTTGDARYRNVNTWDFRPAANSPLLNRVSSRLVPADTDGRAVPVPGAIGAYQLP